MCDECTWHHKTFLVSAISVLTLGNKVIYGIILSVPIKRLTPIAANTPSMWISGHYSGSNGRGRRGNGREEGDYKLYLSLHCHHHSVRMTPALRWAAMPRAESHFIVSLIVKDKVTRQCPQTTTFEEKGEPKPRIRTEVPLLTSRNVLLLGQTGSDFEA